MKSLSSIRRVGRWISAAALVFFLATISRAADVGFYALVKRTKSNQDSAGLPTLGSNNPYRGSAFVRLTGPGSVLSATLTSPGGAPQPMSFDPAANAFALEGKFHTQAELDAAAPAGKYTLNISTLHDGTKILSLTLPIITVYPAAPHISNFAAAQAINPSADFILTWDPIPGGT